MGKEAKRRGRRSRPTILNAIIGGIIGCFISFALAPTLERLLQIVGKNINLYLRTVITLCFGTILYSVLQIGHWLKVSRRWGLTVNHYFKLLKSTNPLGVIILSLQLLFLLCLFFLGSQMGIPKEDFKRTVLLVFFFTAVPLGLLGWILITRLYRNWILDKERTIIETLAGEESGLIETHTEEDKNPEIRTTLATLKKCQFIFVWGLNLSDIIGHESPDARGLISDVLNNNPKLSLFFLLYCPFCNDVIERAIQLDIPHGSEYVAASKESCSNCLAFKRRGVKLSLTHGEPYMRGILWGNFKKGSPLKPFSLTAKASSVEDCHKYLEDVVGGGFLLQEYPETEYVRYAPLYKGSTVEHGGLWNEIRSKFSQEFKKGLKPYKSLANARQETLCHLAHDLGMRKRKAEKSSRDELVNFIKKKPKFLNFLEKTKDLANTKANELKMQEDSRRS